MSKENDFIENAIKEHREKMAKLTAETANILPEETIAMATRSYLDRYPHSSWQTIWEALDKERSGFSSRASFASNMIQKQGIRLKDYRDSVAKGESEIRCEEILIKLEKLEKLDALEFKLDQLTELVSGLTREGEER